MLSSPPGTVPGASFTAAVRLVDRLAGLVVDVVSGYGIGDLFGDAACVGLTVGVMAAGLDSWHAVPGVERRV